MGKIITISPVTRIEGHATITIQLGGAGRVNDARLHVREFRGFEAFCVGRPFWEMPVITARICGICPVSHALAAAKAGDRIIGVAIPPAAHTLRALLSLAQLILSHSLSFFHLSGPDIVLGLDADPAERNIAGLSRSCPEFVRNGVRLRQIGQTIVNQVAGGQLHPECIVPGGMGAALMPEQRDTIAGLLPEALQLVRYGLDLWQGHCLRFREEMGDVGDFPSLFLGLVGDDGYLDHYEGRLRFVSARGDIVADLAPDAYADAITEIVTGDSFMKATTCPFSEDGRYRVGPLARLNVAHFQNAPLANREREALLQGQRTTTHSLDYHHARLIEMLYAVEKIGQMLADPDICAPHVRDDSTAVHNQEGIGIIEAPRGTLIHHYRVDRHGLLTAVRLIVATAHNSRAMDQTITAIAQQHIHRDRLSEGLLNRVEHGIRLYDPCLSCATHPQGSLGLPVELLAPDGRVLDRAVR